MTEPELEASIVAAGPRIDTAAIYHNIFVVSGFLRPEPTVRRPLSQAPSSHTVAARPVFANKPITLERLRAGGLAAWLIVV
jgi:hypothetical protein